jgi:hypothetical protein
VVGSAMLAHVAQREAEHASPDPSFNESHLSSREEKRNVHSPTSPLGRISVAFRNAMPTG